MSAKSAPPEGFAVPAGACDSHLHVYDPREPHKGSVPAEADVHAYSKLRSLLGFSRAVIVQPRPYWTDTSVLLATVAALGRKSTRGIAVLHPDVSDRELRILHDGGVRGVRFSLFTEKNAVVSFDMVEPLARRVNELGWHLQLHWTANQIVQHETLIRRLPTALVFDHMARLPVNSGASHPAFRVVRRLLDEGRAWVKLSGPYLESRTGPDDDFRDVDPIAKAWIGCAPNRLVWGSDWPQNDWHHEKTRAEAAYKLLAALGRWAETDQMLRKLLVDNPAELYGFDKP